MLDLKLKFINITKSELSLKNRKMLESKKLITSKLEKLYKQEKGSIKNKLSCSEKK